MKNTPNKVEELLNSYTIENCIIEDSLKIFEYNENEQEDKELEKINSYSIEELEKEFGDIE